MSLRITKEGKEYIEKKLKEFQEKVEEEYKKFTGVVAPLPERP